MSRGHTGLLTSTARIALGVLLFAANAHAQELTGDWQGVLGTRLRLILKVTQAPTGEYGAILISLDEAGFDDPIRATSVVVRGTSLTATFASTGTTFEGRLSADAATLSGTWTQRRATPLAFTRATAETLWRDPSPHTERFVSVDTGVNLEVLDWGGSGRPIVLLSGLGNTAHVFDRFAPKLAEHYRVYGITRRGFGMSSAPTHGYESDRLGDDVVAVLDNLGLDRPILIGHSIAGQELSSIASRFPERVAGLVYLDAAYGFAYYDPARGHIGVDLANVSRTLAQLSETRDAPQNADDVRDIRASIRQLVESDLPVLERNLREYERALAAMTAPVTAPRPRSFQTAVTAIWGGVRKHTSIPVPALAIFAVPRQLPPAASADAAARAAAEAADVPRFAQAEAFEKGVPHARVVRIPHSTHFVFISNEADVLREIRAFIEALK